MPVSKLCNLVSWQSMPIAFSRYREQGWVRTVWRVLRRVVLLFVLGLVVQGNLCSGEPEHMSLFFGRPQPLEQHCVSAFPLGRGALAVRGPFLCPSVAYAVVSLQA